MRLLVLLFTISIMYIGAYIIQAAHLGKTVYGDGIFYYSWLRSAIIDRDIDFSNDYSHDQVSQPPAGNNELVGNKYSIGPALFWAPLFLITHSIVRGNGWEFPYQFSAGLTSTLAAICAVFLLSFTLRGPPLVIGTVLLLITGATNLLYYGAVDPANSHALSFFVATVLFVLTKQVPVPSFAAGVTLALLASIRLQDIIFAILLFPYIKHLQLPRFIAGFVLAFIPQLVAWFALYGTLKNPYLSGGETFSFFQPQIFVVLFSLENGLFLWTPVIFLGVFGLVLLARKKQWSYLSVFLAQLLIVSSWSSPNQGASVSGRMFVSTLPIIALGLHKLIRSIYKNKLIRVGIPYMAINLVLMNIIGIFYYLFTN